MAGVTELLLWAAAGAVLGLLYFSGLWYTVRRLGRARNPALLVLGSYVGRLAVCLPCFFLAARGGQWGRLLVFTAAFLVVRLVLILRLGPKRVTTTAIVTEE